MDATRLVSVLTHVILTHANEPIKPEKAFRKCDGKTPASIHPILCAMLLLHETSLSEEIREKGWETLASHDIFEDTGGALTQEATEEIIRLVTGMTFKNNVEEMERVWERGSEIILYKLYDKFSNLLQDSVLAEEKRPRYYEYILKLCEEVEKTYGELDIVTVARAIVRKRKIKEELIKNLV